MSFLLRFFLVVLTVLLPSWAVAQPPANSTTPGPTSVQPPVVAPDSDTTEPDAGPPEEPLEQPAPVPDYEFGSFLLAASPLTRVPEMFGDSLPPSMTVTATEFATSGIGISSEAELFLAGGARRAKVAENNRALPTDRTYFTYNHFQNATETNLSGFTPAPFAAQWNDGLDRYTVGVEKTFGCGCWSAELRMPVVSENNFDFVSGSVRSSGTSGNVGNLAAILKHVIYRSCQTVTSTGVAVDLPTGSDAELQTTTVRYRIENEAVCLSPFIALMGTPSDEMFWNAFAQLDVPLNGHTVRYESLPPFTEPDVTVGQFSDQTLLYLDVGGGYWLYRNARRCRPWGVAGIIEFHYTTALADSDQLIAAPTRPGPTSMEVVTSAGRFDLVNATAGLHANLGGNTQARVAAVVPLCDDANRFFDSEIVVQVNHRF